MGARFIIQMTYSRNNENSKIYSLFSRWLTEIKEYKIEISLSWENFPPKPSVNDFDTIVVESREIKWENIPDLFDPFW